MSPLHRCPAAALLISRHIHLHSANQPTYRTFASTVHDHTAVRRQQRPRSANTVDRRPHRPFRDDERIQDDEQANRSTSFAPSSRPFSRRPPSHRSDRSARHSSLSKLSTATDSWSVHRQPVGEFVYGFHSVVAALHANKREVHRVYVQTEKDAADDSTAASSSSALHREREKQQLHAAIQRYSSQLTVDYISRQQLNLLSHDRPHNGVVIDASPLQPPLSDTLPTATPLPAANDVAAAPVPPLWLLLDEVQDPQNLGAILRSAAFFGATGAVLCKKNCAPLSPVASKASSGCLETVDVRWCKSTVRLIDEAKKDGWRVVGLSAEEVNETKRVRDCRQFEVNGPTLLVVGNEGRGLRTMVRQSCDELLSIRGGGTDEAVEVAGLALLDSLNVSTAVAIALYQCSSKRPSAVSV